MYTDFIGDNGRKELTHSLEEKRGRLFGVAGVRGITKVKNENKQEENYMGFTEIREAIEKIEAEFSGSGRVLICPSGTESLVRLMIEGKDETLIRNHAEELVAFMEEKLN